MVSEILTKAKKDKNKVTSHLKQPAAKLAKTENQISVCDVMKNNTSKIIKKVESQIPTTVQMYSDLYSEYLHTYDDLFGTCYIAEKNFFDKLGIDQKTLTSFDEYSNVMTNFYSSQIEKTTNFLATYVKMRISAIKSFDRYMHVIMDSYAKTLSDYNLAVEKWSSKKGGKKDE